MCLIGRTFKHQNSIFFLVLSKKSSCRIIGNIWNHPSTTPWLDLMSNQSDISNLLSEIRPYKETNLKSSFLIWSIWKERNNILFKEAMFNIQKVIQRASTLHNGFSEQTLLKKLKILVSPPGLQTILPP